MELAFGLYPSDRPTEMVAQFRPCLDRLAVLLSSRLGAPVEIRIRIARSYAEGQELLRRGAADFMRLGPVSYVTAKANIPGIALLAVESNHGDRFDYGVVVVKADSPIARLDQLRHRSFAFGSRMSTLSRYVPQSELAKAGIYAADLKGHAYLGRHDRVARHVAAGLYDAGALNERIYAKLVERGVPLRAVYRYRGATKAWVARPGLEAGTAEALRAALLKIRDASVLGALRFDGFLPGEDSFYDETRAAMRASARFTATASRP